MARKPGIFIAWSRREGDFLFTPVGPVTRASMRYAHTALTLKPPPISPMLLDLGLVRDTPETNPGGLLHKKTLAELERRGFDTRRLRIILPLKDGGNR